MANNEINRKAICEFMEYVYKFYGPDGVYDLGFKVDYILVAKATKILLTFSEIDFAGDSFDREKVRDIMIIMNQPVMEYDTIDITL